MTGSNMYKNVLQGAWTGVSSPKYVFVRDYTLYDASIVQACSGFNANSAMHGTPVVGYAGACFLHAEASAKRNILDYASNLMRRWLFSAVEKKAYAIPGLRLPQPLAPGGPPPTYNENSFTVCFPRSDGSLPIRQAVLDEWLTCGSADVQMSFNQLVDEHNKEVNPSGQPWKGNKRAASSTATDVQEESQAVTITPAEGDPKTETDLARALGSFCCTTLQSVGCVSFVPVRAMCIASAR